MIEQVVHPYNLQKALKQVIVNKGSAGIDGKKTTELADYFRGDTFFCIIIDNQQFIFNTRVKSRKRVFTAVYARKYM